MSLLLFKAALKKLNVCSEEDLRKKHKTEQNNQRLETESIVEIKIPDLHTLVQKMDDPISTSIDEIIAKIDAKIAELEIKDQRNNGKNRKGNRDNAEWLQSDIDGLMPKPGFSVRYNFEYIKVLLKILADTEENETNSILENKVQEYVKNLQDRLVSIVFLMLYHLVLLLRSADKETDNYIKIIKIEIRDQLRLFTEKSEFTEDDLEHLCIYRDVLFLVLSISEITSGHDFKTNRHEARTYIFYYLAHNFYVKKESSPTEGLEFAKQGLSLSDPEDRQDAFNTLGVCAIGTHGCKQLAYDTYYSWLYMQPKILNEHNGISLDQSLFGDEEDEWRKKSGKKQTALMHANYAYICGIIADTYELKTPRWRVFSDKAIEQIELAINMDKAPAYYCTYGTLLSEKNELDASFGEVIKQYQKYYNGSKRNIADQITASRCLGETRLDELLSRLLTWNKDKNNMDKDFSEWASQDENVEMFKTLLEGLDDYRVLLQKVQDIDNLNDREKRNPWEAFFMLYERIKNEDRISLFRLLLIFQISNALERLLKRREYSSTHFYSRDMKDDDGVDLKRDDVRPIAYYTTLKNATYLFDVLHRVNNHTAPYVVGPDKKEQYRDGVNCLTMMHAHYMNDPREGLVLAECINRGNPHANVLFYRGEAARFREDIYEKYFIFLKSFTDKRDNLLMWNRYGSDRNQGSKDSNGCYMQFNTDLFEKVVNDLEITSKNKLFDEADDYALYRVVYVSEDGSIDDAKNPKLPSHVKDCYNLLLKLMIEVNEDLYKQERSYPVVPEQERTKAIREFIQMTLKRLIFLFKHDDYEEEAEYRLVETRSHKQIDGIRLIQSEPNMLCINPFFQVCVDKIILGPNVLNPERWITYFRYQLIKMWQRSFQSSEKDMTLDFTIEKSKIHYHT